MKAKFTARDLFILESAVLGATVAEIADLVGETEHCVRKTCSATRERLICCEPHLKHKRNRSVQHDAMDWIEAINRARGVLDGR